MTICDYIACTTLSLDLVDSPILNGFLNVPSDLATNIKTELLRIIQDNWDAFAPAGARRPMLGFQFCIETGASAPVACRQSHYGIHESPILQEHINDLLHNAHIVPTIEGGWLSKALLAPKPHQEHVHNILEFIWRFCINYRPLNSVTEPYLYPLDLNKTLCHNDVIVLVYLEYQVNHMSAREPRK